MKTITMFCALLLSFNAPAQKPPIKFGNVPLEDLKMTIYTLDSSATAVVLADYGESTIVYSQIDGFELQFERIRRIKILNKEGYDWANFIIPLYKRNNTEEKLQGLKAVTVNLEGNKDIATKLGKDGIFKEAISENWDHVKLTLPNVKEGSVIDMSYHISSPWLINFQDWEFQESIPVKWSEYIARIPEYFEYQRYMQGYVSIKINDNSSERKFITINSKEKSGGTGYEAAKTTFHTDHIEYMENYFRWVASDVPALKEEPFMTTHRNYISKINFELERIKIPNEPIKNILGSWENINKELLDATEFGGVVKRSNFLNKTLEEIIIGKESDMDRISAVYDYVKANVEWNGNHRLYTDGNFKRVIEEKRGSVADINLMLVSMLQKSGLRADPVVISTRNHGFVRQPFPASSQFNYVICAVQLDNKIILLDGTDRSLPMMMLPERCLNGQGLVISETASKWVQLASPVKTRTVVEASLGFKEEGALKGQVKVTKHGYDGQRMRLAYHESGEEAYLKSHMDRNGWSVHSSKFENLKDLNEPSIEIYEISLVEGNNTTSEILYVNPMLSNAIKENPFKLQSREYPVDFGSAFEKISLIKINIPKGYVVDELPQSIAIALPENGGKYTYNISSMNGVISLTSLMSINKESYTQREYPNLREFYNQIVAKQAELIVLRRKTE